MADRFFLDAPLGLGRVELDGTEAHHLASVSRVRLGDAVCLFNGDGNEYRATVVAMGKRSVQLEIVETLQPKRELPFRLEVASALPKGDRAQFLVEKLTELGVTRFTPLQTQRGVVQPREAKLDKLARHVVEASKQCGRNVLMAIGPLTTWERFVADAGLPNHRVLAHPNGGSLVGLREDVVYAVGPEGGFTDSEVTLALSHGWTTVGLGSRILRVETAALAIAALSALG